MNPLEARRSSRNVAARKVLGVGQLGGRSFRLESEGDEDGEPGRRESLVCKILYLA
jgi:hypothetical protein